VSSLPEVGSGLAPQAVVTSAQSASTAMLTGRVKRRRTAGV